MPAVLLLLLLLLLGGGYHRGSVICLALLLLLLGGGYHRGALSSCFVAVVVGRLVDPPVVRVVVVGRLVDPLVVAAAGWRLHPGKTSAFLLLGGVLGLVAHRAIGLI